MDFHLNKQWPHPPHHSSSSPAALSLFSSQPMSTKLSPTPNPKETMGMGCYLSMGQWQELEIQALIYKHMLTASPIPPQLLNLLFSNNYFTPLYQTGGGYWGRGGMDAEPGRCRRTDGKKWRCSRDVVAGHKYCERHVHRGRNRSRKPVEIPTPTSSSVAAHSPCFDRLHLSQRISEYNIESKSSFSSTSLHETENKSSNGRILRPFFEDWPQTVQEQEMLATSLSISVPGNTSSSDFSLKLATGNDNNVAVVRREEEINTERERVPLNWGTLWGTTHHVGTMGGPLAEALRSSSTSNSSSPTSVLNQLQRGNVSDTSYVST